MDTYQRRFAFASLVTGAAWWASSLYSRVGYAEHNISAQKSTQDEILKELRKINEVLIRMERKR